MPHSPLPPPPSAPSSPERQSPLPDDAVAGLSGALGVLIPQAGPLEAAILILLSDRSWRSVAWLSDRLHQPHSAVLRAVETVAGATDWVERERSGLKENIRLTQTGGLALAPMIGQTGLTGAAG